MTQNRKRQPASKHHMNLVELTEEYNCDDMC